MSPPCLYAYNFNEEMNHNPCSHNMRIKKTNKHWIVRTALNFRVSLLSKNINMNLMCRLTRFLSEQIKNLTYRESSYLFRSSSASDKGGAGSSEGGAELRDHRIAQWWRQPKEQWDWDMQQHKWRMGQKVEMKGHSFNTAYSNSVLRQTWEESRIKR